MIDVTNRDKYIPVFEKSFDENELKYIGLLQNVNNEQKSANGDYVKTYTVLVAKELEEVKNGKYLLDNAIKKLAKNGYKLIGRENVSLDIIKLVLEKAGGLNTESTKGSLGEVKDTFDEILSDALKKGASDIHILSLEKGGCTVYFKIDGELEKAKELSFNLSEEMISAVYTADGKDIEGTHFNKATSQQAVIPKKINGVDIQLRFQSSNVFGGFKVVMRILNLGKQEDSENKTKYTRLDQLGYAPSQIDNIESGVAKPVGATIIAGVTGSGKSTTLKNLLMKMNHDTDFKKVFYTLEDPVEYLIPGVTQIGVSRNTNGEGSFVGSPYKKPLAVLMRFDPDVIMLGEIRDEATAEGLTKATESGHKVLSTTHASSALEIIKRLYGFGVSANDMASPSFLSCLIYQKLMPVLCEHCRIPLVEKISDGSVEEKFVSIKKRLQSVCDLNRDKIFVRNEKGCPHCNFKGAKGRTVCAETIIPDLTLLTYFRDNKMIEAKEYWRGLSDKNRDSNNFTGKTVLEHAIYKMRQGLISPLDVEIELGPIDAAYKEWQEIEQREMKKREKIFDQHLFSGLKTSKKQDENNEFDL